MDQDKLVKEIVKSCMFFKVFPKYSDDNLIEKKIIDGLEDIIFVENLLNILYKKMKLKRFKDSLNFNRLKKLLIELEKVRLELEFKGVEENA